MMGHFYFGKHMNTVCTVCSKSIIGNKKSFSNHARWCRGLMSRESYKGIHLGEKNNQWRGNSVGYGALHNWIRRHLPKPLLCEKCETAPPHDVANKSGKYLRNLEDWNWLCRSCHMKIDGRIKNLKQYAYLL
jgi:hypothetical protein